MALMLEKAQGQSIQVLRDECFRWGTAKAKVPR